MYQHWFVSRQKRKLTQLLLATIAFSDFCVGEKWRGNKELQLKLEDELQNREITNHGSLRARKSNDGGGGIRTLFKQLRDLGLVFVEDDNGKCRLTLIGEDLVKGKVTFVDAMRLQLQRYQYPSATTFKGTGSISSDFRIHPFQFIFRLLRDERLENKLTADEMAGIVIHYAKSDSKDNFEKIVNLIVKYRVLGNIDEFKADTKNTYGNIANTFFNYIEITQYINRSPKAIHIRSGKEDAVDKFIQEKPTFIPHPELQENYIRAYGKGFVAKDLRNFDKEGIKSQREINEARISREYVLTSLKTPITGITQDVIDAIVLNTGIDERTVEKYLLKNYPNGNVDDFFVSYKELSNLSAEGATEFEIATGELFKKIFKMDYKHVGPKGNSPDVLVESERNNFCGIIDTKAYQKGYSISGDHRRVMIDVYIPEYQKYGQTQLPLAFYSYVSGSFKKNIDADIKKICDATGVDGCAMPVDILIKLAQDYAEKRYSHLDVKKIFSVNREVRLADLDNLGQNTFSYSDIQYENSLRVAENDEENP